MSPQRVDYYDSPEAPKANSLVPAVNVVVANDAGEILMIRRTDNGNWAVPGGGVDLGESVAQAAVRETLEESGIECAITGIVGIYSDPRHVILYTSNGEARQEFSIVLTARALSGQPTPNSESRRPQTGGTTSPERSTCANRPVRQASRQDAQRVIAQMRADLAERGSRDGHHRNHAAPHSPMRPLRQRGAGFGS